MGQPGAQYNLGRYKGPTQNKELTSEGRNARRGVRLQVGMCTGRQVQARWVGNTEGKHKAWGRNGAGQGKRQKDHSTGKGANCKE